MNVPFSHSCRGCPGHCVSRRKFLQGCGASLAAAGMAGLPAMAKADNASPAKKPRVGVLFLCADADHILWPYVGRDFVTPINKIMAGLTAGVTDVEFKPLRIDTKVSADALPPVEALDREVDGWMVFLLCTNWGTGGVLLRTLAKNPKPLVMVDDLFAGSGTFLCNYSGLNAAGFKPVAISSSRFQDVVDVASCFRMLRDPKTTVDKFTAECERIRRANFAKPNGTAPLEDKLQLANIGDVVEQLKQTKVLLVGRGDKPHEMLGVKVQPISFDEIQAACKAVNSAQANEWADRWTDGAEKIVEPTRNDLVHAGEAYLAMNALMDKHQAQGITVNCLGGIYSGKLTGYPCLGFMQLNSDGKLMGTCEGMTRDLVSLFAAKYLCGRSGFASDPVLDTAKNQIIYAHCVAPYKMFGPEGPSNPWIIRTHAEDHAGASVQSLLPLGYMTTTFDLYPERGEMLLHQARAVENVDTPLACRTKLAAEVQGDIGKLFNYWNHGWHRVTVYGDLADPMRELAAALKLKVIEEA